MIYKGFIFFLLLLTGCGGGSGNNSSSSTSQNNSTIAEVAPINELPTVNAGQDSSVDEQTLVSLQGSANDTDGTISSIQWRQIEGPTVDIIDPTSLNASFISPIVSLSSGTQMLSLELIVIDDADGEQKDTIHFEIEPVNDAPMANAGDDVTIMRGETVSLDCTNSVDSDAQTLTYLWSQVSNYSLELTDVNACQPSFYMNDNIDSVEFSLTVTDELGESDIDTMIVTSRSYDGEKISIATNPFSHSILVGELELDNEANAVTVDNGIAYVAGTAGLNLIDVSSQTLLASYSTSTPILDVLVEGNYAFLAKGTSGISIIDISEPTFSITEISRFVTTNAITITKKDNYLYVADGTSGIKIINISNKFAPLLTKQLLMEDARSVEVSGNYAYATGHQTNQNVSNEDYLGGVVKVIDISTPNTAAIVAEKTFITKGIDITIIGSTAYVLGENDSNLVDLDISNPLLPLYKRALTVDSTATSILVDDNYVYSIGSNGILERIITPMQSGNISRLVNIDTQCTASDIFFYEDKIFVVSGNGKFKIFDFNEASDSFLLGEVSTGGGYGSAIALKDNNYAFIVDHKVKSIGISSPTPWVADTFSEIGHVNDISIVGSYAYVAIQETGFNIYDISEPNNIQKISQTLTPGCLSKSVTIYDEFAYLLCINSQSRNMKIFDINNPVFPEQVGALEMEVTPSYTGGNNPFYIGNELSIKDGFAYIAYKNKGLRVVDVSVPSTPELVTLIQTNTSRNGRALSVAINKDYAYIASGVDGITVVNISKPKEPKIVRVIDIENAESLSINNNYLYVTGDDLYIFDVSDASNPIKAGHLESEGVFESVDIGEYVYLAGSEGLSIFDIEPVKLEQTFSNAESSSQLSYNLAWDSMNAKKAICQVTNGNCNIDINTDSKSAQINWLLSDTKGDHEIVIIIGDNGFYSEVRDQITIN